LKNKNRLIVLAFATIINIGLILTLELTSAVLVSDHHKSILEWALAIIYLPHTVLFALAIDIIFGRTHPGYAVMLFMAFICGLPVSFLYALGIRRVQHAFSNVQLP
jgi:hypothetical protein